MLMGVDQTARVNTTDKASGSFTDPLAQQFVKKTSEQEGKYFGVFWIALGRHMWCRTFCQRVFCVVKADTDQGEHCLPTYFIEHCSKTMFLNSVDKHAVSRPKLIFQTTQSVAAVTVGHDIEF